MADHTPGPWEHGRPVKASNYPGMRALVSGPESAMVAFAYGGNAPFDDREAVAANARLIAAAPDLLVVALLALELGPGNLPYLKEQAAAAIAKAEGR